MKTGFVSLIILLLLLTGCNELSFVPGTYTAEAEGYGGKITADVTFSSESLMSVVVTSHSESPNVGANAIKPAIKKMIAANGTGIDGISGATYTVDGIRDLVNNAATMAKVNKPKKFARNK